MQAGRLRHRVTIEYPLKIQNESGEVIVDTWRELATVWAAVEPIAGREYLTASEIRAGVTTRIRMRYRDDITPEMRATHDGVIYSIDAVIPINLLGRELHLMCSSGIVTEGGQP